MKEVQTMFKRAPKEEQKVDTVPLNEDTPVNKGEAISIVRNEALTQSTDIGSQHQRELPYKHYMAIVISTIIVSLRAISKVTLISSRAVASYVIYHPIHAITTIALVTALVLMSNTGIKLQDSIVRKEISSVTVNRIVNESQFTRGFNNSKMASLGSRELLRVGAPGWMQRESVTAILHFAREAGLSIEEQAVLLATAEVESGFNPMARAATTSACGLFQFVKRTGTVFGLPPSECMDPWRNAEAGVAHYVSNYQKRLKDKIDGETAHERLFQMYSESYYLHHDGVNSRDPSNDVKAVVVLGTQFLLKVYDILKAEEEQFGEAPSFSDKFHETVLEATERINTEALRTMTVSTVLPVEEGSEL